MCWIFSSSKHCKYYYFERVLKQTKKKTSPKKQFCLLPMYLRYLSGDDVRVCTCAYSYVVYVNLCILYRWVDQEIPRFRCTFPGLAFQSFHLYMVELCGKTREKTLALSHSIIGFVSGKLDEDWKSEMTISSNNINQENVIY